MDNKTENPLEYENQFLRAWVKELISIIEKAKLPLPVTLKVGSDTIFLFDVEQIKMSGDGQ
jgi:hypothetical protein